LTVVRSGLSSEHLIKNGGLHQYGAEPFKQQQFVTAGVEGVNSTALFCWQGVKFMYDCVTGKQIEGSTGCIMADEMVTVFKLSFCGR